MMMMSREHNLKRAEQQSACVEFKHEHTVWRQSRPRGTVVVELIIHVVKGRKSFMRTSKQYSHGSYSSGSPVGVVLNDVVT